MSGDVNFFRIPLNAALVIGISPAADKSTINFGKYGSVVWNGDEAVTIIDIKGSEPSVSSEKGNGSDPAVSAKKGNDIDNEIVPSTSAVGQALGEGTNQQIQHIEFITSIDSQFAGSNKENGM